MFVLTIGRYADVTAPALYGRPVNLYWDARHLPNVGAMLAEVAKPWMLAAFLAGLVAFVALIGGALYFALARVERSLTDARSRRPLGALAAVLVAAYFVGYVLEPIGYWFSAPVLATYRDQLAFVLEARSDTARRALPDRPLAPSDLGRVRGADVLLIFLESYGAVTYDSPPIAEIVANGRRELAAAAAATGREVSSAFVESTTFGGSSWLAHLSLMSGVEVRERTGAIFEKTHPEQVLIIAEPSAAVLDVRLLHGGGVSKLGVAGCLIFHSRFDVFLLKSCHTLVHQLPAHH